MNTDKNNTQLPQSSVKSRFFSQYWGQEICQTKGGRFTINEDCFPLWNRAYLELKSLSEITDEEAIEISKIFGWNHYSDESKIHQVKNFVIDCSNYHSSNISSNENFNLIDFLRSKGYAVPFMEYSVDYLISFGWVQLL